MTPVPWSYIESWSCTACGICCRGFKVVLNFNEWVNIVRKYGVEVTEPGINKFYLKRRSDGSCVFLYKFFDRWLCGLQRMKPRACKLWPFKIYDRPKFGRFNEAAYNFRGRRLFVYVDPLCPGIRWGKPAPNLVYKTIPEFIEIALNLRRTQYYSTSRIPYQPVYLRLVRKESPFRTF